MKVALVHDWLNQVGGAEDVLAALVRLFPDAPIYTSLYDRARMPAAWRAWDIRPLWMDRLPGIHAHHQPYLPLYPLAFGGLDLSGYDVILSNKSGFCHGVRGRPHLCYCLAPTRYVWQFDSYAAREQFGGATRRVIQPLLSALRRWDYAAAQRVDQFVAISHDIQSRIATFYQRDSTIIYPPVETGRFAPASRNGDYFLVVSRLIPYKRIDLAVRACTELNLPLLVGGKGRDLDRLRSLAGPSVKFLGFVADDELPALMAGCRAFLFPGFEDFGITPVQAMAAGRPVIAFAGGGALDTVIPGVTGELFHAQTVGALKTALTTFDDARYSSAAIRTHALQFDSAVFDSQIVRAVNDLVHGIATERESSVPAP